VYKCEERAHATRYGQQFAWSKAHENEPQCVRYASIRHINDHTVTLHSTASIPRELSQPTAFWDVLCSFENQTLWRDFRCDGDGSWIHRGLLMGLLVIVHDGSFMSKVAKDVRSAGFIIYCMATKQTAKGTVVERSPDADNYRSKILGGIMVQLVLRAASQCRASPYWM